MKVLHFYKSYLPDNFGGVEQVICQIALSTTKLGVVPEVLSLSPSLVDRTIKVGNHVAHRCRSNFEIASTPFSMSAILKFRQLAQEVDIIHYHFPYPFADFLNFLVGVNKPSVVTYHSDIVRQKYLFKLYQPLMNNFLNDVDAIVSTSPNYLRSSKVLSRFANKVSVIPIGIDKSTYPTQNKCRLEYWQKRFGGGRFFLFLGVMRYYKGLHILIEAAINSSYQIVVAGAGPIEKKLKEQAEDLSIKNIAFVGHVSDEDKVALFTLSYAILFPSHLRSEAFGVSLLEGAMFGKPLISSEIGTGTTYVNVDGETGVVVPPSTPGALRDAMDYLWSNPRIAKKMGERAKDRYYRLFTAEEMAKSYFNLYQSLLS